MAFVWILLFEKRYCLYSICLVGISVCSSLEETKNSRKAYCRQDEDKINVLCIRVKYVR